MLIIGIDWGTIDNGPVYRSPKSFATGMAANGAEIKPMGENHPAKQETPLVNVARPIDEA